MMYGKDSVKCTDVRLVNDHVYYEVVIRYTDLGKQFDVTWYGCHKTQHLNPADKDYAQAVRTAVKWSKRYPRDGRCYKTTVHIDKYLKHVFRGGHSCVFEDRVDVYDPETGLISKVYPGWARDVDYQFIRQAARKPVSRVEKIMAEIAGRGRTDGRETEAEEKKREKYLKLKKEYLELEKKYGGQE